MEKFILADINAVGEKEETLRKLAEGYEAQGADGFYIYDYTREESVRDRFLHIVRDLPRTEDLPFAVGVAAERFEDIKKALYTGAQIVYVPYEQAGGAGKQAVQDGLARFGESRVGLLLDYSKGECSRESLAAVAELGIRRIMVKHLECAEPVAKRLEESGFDVTVRDSLRRNDLADLLSSPPVRAVATDFYDGKDIRRIKLALKEQGIVVRIPQSRIPFAEFKKGPDGLVPVIVQDHRTSEVLMLAYMNEESYNKTIETGKMTYFSRSRNELWVKGETSGNFQYVKDLSIDCDRDTILAKVRQIGVACHTGSRSCFFTELSVKEASAHADVAAGFSILKDVYETILERKTSPKEGSYTNYLFEKGIDKILKKCGEEATEIVIAAKNPDDVELKYEIADFLYHLMVLMAEKGLGWDEVMEELGNRH